MQYLCQPVFDEEYDLYLEAWLVYHRTADKIDGHIRFPVTREEREICNNAARAAVSAQREFMASRNRSIINNEKWQRAKIDSLRKLEKTR